MGVSSSAGPVRDSEPCSYTEAADPTGSPKPARASFWQINRWPQPYQLGIKLAVGVFLSEALIMILLSVLPAMPVWAESLLDASLITLFLAPPLYAFMLRPLVIEIGERTSAQEQLVSRNQELLAVTAAEQHQRQLAEALTEATVALNSSLDLDEVLDRILEQAQRVASSPVVAVLRLNGDWVDVSRQRGLVDDHPLTNGFPLELFPRVQASAATSIPLVIEDTSQDAEWISPPGLEWVRSFVLAPMVEEQDTIGFLTTLSDQPGDFPVDVSDFLVTFATYAAVAVHRAHAYQAEHWARETAEILSAASLALTQTLDLQTVLDVLLKYLHRLIPFSVGSVMLLESESRLALRARATFEGDTGVQAGSAIPNEIDLLESPRCQALLQSQQCVLVRNRAEAMVWLPDIATGMEMSCVSVPIVAGGRPLGLCCLEKKQADAFTLENGRLAEAVVSQAAVAIQNASLFQQVRAGHERLQSLSRRLVDVQENERIHVARELHDEAAQMLSSMTLGLKMLEQHADDPAAVVEDVQELRESAQTVQENLNRLAMDLRPASLDYLGLVAAINTYINKMQDQDGISVQFKAVGWSGERLPAEVEISIYRIAQEALTNIVRHAQAKHVDVLLQKELARISLMVEDDGVGFDMKQSSAHLGLVGIRERCEMLGGTVLVESSPGQGATLVVKVPYDDTSTRM